MKTKLYYLAIIVMAILLSGCASARHVEKRTEVKTDSVKTVTRIEFVKDTVIVEIPSQTAERVTRDSVSRLENEYARSEARINPDGSLYHDLNTKPQKKPVAFDKPVEKTETEKTHTEVIKVEIPREVPRSLSWWEQTQIYGFWAALIFVVITYTIKRLKRHIERIR